MKSSNNNLNSKEKLLKEIEQKEEYKDVNLNNSKDEGHSGEDEIEKNTINNKNTNGNSKSTLKNISKKNSLNDIDSKLCTHNPTENRLNDADIQKHKRCVPLEIYKKVYQDKQTLINQVDLLNKEILSLNNNSKNEEIKILENKYKNMQREKTSIENILLNQEKYVDKLKKKIEKLEKQILIKNEDIVQKDNNITELNDKIEELNNKIKNMKQNFKLAEKKEIMKLNEKITYLSNEIEIKQSKIDFIVKRHKHLQLKYLKLIGDKRKMTPDIIPILKTNKEKEKDKDKDKFSEIINITGSKGLESVKSYNSIKKNENIKNKNKINNKNDKNNINNNSKNINLSKEIHLPEIKNKNKKYLSLQKDKNVNEAKNNALKDLNMLLSDYSEGGEKDEEMEDEDNNNNNNSEEKENDDS